MSQENSVQSIPIKWFVILPSIGVAHALLGRIGWLEQGSWLNFLLLLGVGFLWIIVVLKETAVPFLPLVWIGTITAGTVAAMDLLSWFFFRESLGLSESGWSLEDLLTAISYFLRMVVQTLGNFLLGIILSILVGFTAKMILKLQHNRK